MALPANRIKGIAEAVSRGAKGLSSGAREARRLRRLPPPPGEKLFPRGVAAARRGSGGPMGSGFRFGDPAPRAGTRATSARARARARGTAGASAASRSRNRATSRAVSGQRYSGSTSSALVHVPHNTLPPPPKTPIKWRGKAAMGGAAALGGLALQRNRSGASQGLPPREPGAQTGIYGM